MNVKLWIYDIPKLILNVFWEDIHNITLTKNNVIPNRKYNVATLNKLKENSNVRHSANILI
jgi:hypothetical protein